MPQLTELATTPGVNLALITQSDRVALSAMNIYDIYVLQGCEYPNVVLGCWIASAELATVTSTPCENLAALVDCGCVVVT
jgi:hypothetical protein